LGLLTVVIGSLICVAIGAVGLYCPSFFERYTRTWEQRLNDSLEAEKKLNRILEVVRMRGRGPFTRSSGRS